MRALSKALLYSHVSFVLLALGLCAGLYLVPSLNTRAHSHHHLSEWLAPAAAMAFLSGLGFMATRKGRSESIAAGISTIVSLGLLIVAIASFATIL
jgi:hypothetical protein